MATDRLAAYRAQRQADQPPHMSPELMGMNATGNENGPSLPEMNDFRVEVSSVQDAIATFNANVTRISALNTRSLNASPENDVDAVKQELDGLVAATMALSTQLKDRLKQLQATVLPGARGRQEKEMRRRVTHVRARFTEALQTFAQVEQDYRAKLHQRIEGQYKIVKPDATPEEIADAISGGGDQVSMQALTTSLSSEARSAFTEVQSQAQDVQRVEQTLKELAQLFHDMTVLVGEQDDSGLLVYVEKHAAEGLKDPTIAIDVNYSVFYSHPRYPRWKRWLRFFICSS
ncbi:Syntaxin-like protein psy1 [Mycena sanguinolenta]|uniref:Syntaxin-like protein psy1 n=1 Tax=Mycena sanguinolenta TaxID=230812 RepID=A0A8H6ZAM3_9AGAR|nr:Syntaxin-like protein psy1 [Mycena sanguinolenta]